MTTSHLGSNQKRSINPKFLLAGALISILLLLPILGLEFYYQYLHNPAVHIFFQSKGIFLFWSCSGLLSLNQITSTELALIAQQRLQALLIVKKSSRFLRFKRSQSIMLANNSPSSVGMTDIFFDWLIKIPIEWCK